MSSINVPLYAEMQLSPFGDGTYIPPVCSTCDRPMTIRSRTPGNGEILFECKGDYNCSAMQVMTAPRCELCGDWKKALVVGAKHPGTYQWFCGNWNCQRAPIKESPSVVAAVKEAVDSVHGAGAQELKSADADSPLLDLARIALVELRTAAVALLDQLNSMNFQDHTREEVLRLESRRRAVFQAVMNNNGNWRDRALESYGEVMPTAGGYRFEGLREGAEERVVYGRAYLDGNYFHMVAIAVHDVNGEQVPVLDPNKWYYDLAGRLNIDPMTTRKLPGLSGDYVICIYPGGK